MRFSRDGRHLLSRDYMTVKLWDLNMESKPVASFPVHEPLREKVRPSAQVWRPVVLHTVPCCRYCNCCGPHTASTSLMGV